MKKDKKAKTEITETTQPTIIQFAVGRRKTSTVRARVYSGEGKITVNGKPAEKYFVSPASLKLLYAPLHKTGTSESYDISLKAVGGGLTGQLGASILAISRSLSKINDDIKTTLSKEGFMTRDPRGKERKKVYRLGARKVPQSSKR